MSETGALLTEMTERLLSEHFDDTIIRAARRGEWPASAWQAAVEQGLPLALVAGEQGFDIPVTEGLALIRLLGRHAVPVPIAETMVANALLARAGLPVAEGVVALVPDGAGIALRTTDNGWHATGEADRIAWGRHADAVLIADGNRIAVATSGFRTMATGENIAAMPRDRIAIDAPVFSAPLSGATLLETASLARAIAMAGALETVLTLTIAHVTERVQFGRPLSAFQAIQHSLASLAGEVAAASAAADLATEAFADGRADLTLAIAAARSRISDAAGIAIGLAHQLHGAIGFTEEHRLHWFTTALWSWRDEFGPAAWWTRKLGAAALGHPERDYWPFITSV